MQEYKNSHIELKFKMLALQKYLVLILKICGISAEELAGQIGVTDHLIRNFMSNPVRAVMPRSTFISIMSILEIEKKRNENGFILRIILNSILSVPVYYEAKKMYGPDLDLLRQKSKKVLSKATDTEELKSLDAVDGLKILQSFTTFDSALKELTPEQNELQEMAVLSGENYETVKNILSNCFEFFCKNGETILEESFENCEIKDYEKAFNNYQKKLREETLKAVLPNFYDVTPEDIEDHLKEKDVENFFVDLDKKMNPFKDEITDDGIYGWLDSVHSTGKIDSLLNDEIDALVLKEKNLDAALEKLYSYYLQKM